VETVRVVRARDRIALLGALRLALGLVLAGLALTRVGRGQLVLGLVLGSLGFGIVAGLRQLELGRGDAVDGLPGGAVVVRPLGSALISLLASSLGVFVLGCGALVSDSRLTPLLAGILVGMALTTFASLAQITSDERLRRHRLYTSLDAPPRTFVVPLETDDPGRTLDGGHLRFHDGVARGRRRDR